MTLRIVGGKWRGRRLGSPPGQAVRPTADRVRQAWMNIVDLHLPDARVLDLYAGSGALGLEALSRGAAHVDFVDSDQRSLRTLSGNVATMGADDLVAIHREDAIRFASALERSSYDVAFADPPYLRGGAAGLATRWLAVPFARILGVEHHADEAMPEGGATRRYGATAITFYHLPDSQVSP